jgi:hypothetical protein
MGRPDELSAGGEAVTVFFPHTIRDGLQQDAGYRLCCTFCGKSVSTPFYPFKTDTPDGGLIVRAIIQCPECLEQQQGEKGIAVAAPEAP